MKDNCGARQADHPRQFCEGCLNSMVGDTRSKKERLECCHFSPQQQHMGLKGAARQPPMEAGPLTPNPTPPCMATAYLRKTDTEPTRQPLLQTSTVTGPRHQQTTVFCFCLSVCPSVSLSVWSSLLFSFSFYPLLFLFWNQVHSF